MKKKKYNKKSVNSKQEINNIFHNRNYLQNDCTINFYMQRNIPPFPACIRRILIPVHMSYKYRQ